MTAYYNEIDSYAAQWLRNLIEAGHIAPGDVDERSIVDVSAADLKGYTQCHFFAGIGGWSYALRLAGWPDDRPVWTGSCPCQPFSTAGKGKAQKDERHLWPHWFRLIAAVHPGAVFGEQVTGAIAHGWLDDAFDDLEREGYETGAAVLPACSVGAPHKRDRLWFGAQSIIDQSQRGAWQSSSSSFVENSTSAGREQGQSTSETTGHGDTIISAGGDASIMADAACQRRDGGKSDTTESARWNGIKNGDSFIPHTISERGCGGFSERENAEDVGELSGGEGGGPWNTEPAVGRVANGIPARAHKLRAYGNAIVPQVAAEFIKAAGGY